MKAAERQLRIRQMIEARDFLALETLCQELDASESSVRRDLDILEQTGALRRVYGGAVSLHTPPNRAFDYAVESARLSSEKDRIARRTAELVEDGQTVILDGGSTVAAVARELSAKSLHIVTNSLPIAESLEPLRNIELTLTGGYLDPRLRVMLGPFCEQMLGAIRADVLIMGIGSITEAGFSNNNTLVVGSEQKMIAVASRVIIVADHTKFGRGGVIPVAPLSAAHVVVTDTGVAPVFVEMLRSHGVEVLLA
ncbi:MAG TPA: DeoR/GlpR family DNA-binding transcription regulator [Terracidiphilus sp.]|jgi:DeoR family transcriptional regulator, fructose operon transcriptional repressor|nr:DeoR/GlpR family DNA-binding transcription regulator [Terracidiphilus sp.]